MKCDSCGANVDFGSFCPYCGNKISRDKVEVKEENHGNWLVAILKSSDGKYVGFDFYTHCETDPLKDYNRCLKFLAKDVQEELIKDGGLEEYEDVPSKEDYENSGFIIKHLKKQWKVEYCYIDVVFEKEDILENYGKKSEGKKGSGYEYEEQEDEDYEEDEFFDEDDGFDSEDEFFEEDDDFDEEDVGFGGEVSHRSHMAQSSSKAGVYAAIRKRGMFFEGVIPGLSFGTVQLADSREECIKELKEKYHDHSGGMLDKTEEYPLKRVELMYKNWEIIKIK